MAKIEFEEDDVLTCFEVNDVLMYLRNQMRDMKKDGEYTKECVAIIVKMNEAIKLLNQLTWDAYPMSRKPKSRRPRT